MMKSKVPLAEDVSPQPQLPFAQAAEAPDDEDQGAHTAAEEHKPPMLGATQFRFLLREGDLVRQMGEIGAATAFLQQFENWITSDRRPGTARNYLSDVAFFFSGTPSWAELMAFFSLEALVLRQRMSEYRSLLIRFHLKPTTVKRRLTALRVLLRFAEELGLAAPGSSEQVPIEQAPKERDVQPLSSSQLQSLLQAPGVSTLAGLRDTAILRLLSRAALQREEVCALNQEDFDAQARHLRVLYSPYRGCAPERVQVPVHEEEAEILSKYLQRGQAEGVLRMGADQPLFQNLDGRLRPVGERLTGNSIYYVVSLYRGHTQRSTLSPRDLRDGAIATALKDAGGDVRFVTQQFPHIRPSVLSTYAQSSR